MSLGASLRDRAFRCNLRCAPISAAIPRASARLRLAARSACRGGSLRSPPVPDRHASASVRRRCAGDRRVRLAHHPSHQCLRSCGRSCGARPHFAPHHGGHYCPRRCGQRRLRLRPSAAHAPRWLPSAGFPGVDSPFASLRIPAPTGRRSALVAHTPRAEGAVRPWPPLPSLSGPARADRGRGVAGPSGLRAQLANRHHRGPAGPPLATTDMRRVSRETPPQCAVRGREFRPHARERRLQAVPGPACPPPISAATRALRPTGRRGLPFHPGSGVPIAARFDPHSGWRWPAGTARVLPVRSPLARMSRRARPRTDADPGRSGQEYGARP